MGKLYLRYAVQDDCKFLFDLVNDKECRENSLDSRQILMEDHAKWFEKTLHTDTKKIYILMDDEERIGQGRLELLGYKCRISYSIIPARRGGGYGKQLLELLGYAAVQEFSQCQLIYGEVLQKNVVSQKAFEDLGYIAEDVGDYFLYNRQSVSFSKNEIGTGLNINHIR